MCPHTYTYAHSHTGAIKNSTPIKGGCLLWDPNGGSRFGTIFGSIFLRDPYITHPRGCFVWLACFIGVIAKELECSRMVLCYTYILQINLSTPTVPHWGIPMGYPTFCCDPWYLNSLVNFLCLHSLSLPFSIYTYEVNYKIHLIWSGFLIVFAALVGAVDYHVWSMKSALHRYLDLHRWGRGGWFQVSIPKASGRLCLRASQVQE